MILVVAMLVLMVLAGTAYMQRARLDRMSTDQAANRGSIDQVAAATIEQIKSVLRDDLIYDPVGGTPQFLNPATPAFDEPHDYPWTNAASVSEVMTKYQQPWNTTTRARGGRLDDMWLASSYPTDLDTDINGGIDTYGWEHITNLNGIFLDLPRPTAKDGSKLPIEWVISKATSGAGNWNGYLGGNADDPLNNTNTAQTDTNLPLFDGAGNIPGNPTTWTLTTATDPTIAPVGPRANSDTDDYQPRGYDVDGDGVPDSRWTWAPIRQTNGIDYVMAVRIIDNSSMINVNAAGAQWFNPATNAMGNQPLGAWPTSADISRLLVRAGYNGNNGGWDGSISAMMRRREPFDPDQPPLSFNPSPGLTVGATQITIDRLTQLGEASRYWGAPGFPAGAPDVWPGLINYGQYGRDPAWFGPADEIALRLGNGVRSARFGKTDLETYLSDYSGNVKGIARAGWTSEEDNFLQVVSSSNFNRQYVREFFEGIGADPNGYQPWLINRNFPDVRKWLTTWSGAAELAGMWDTPGTNESRRAAFPLPPINFSAGAGSTPTTRTADWYALFDTPTAGENNDLPELHARLRQILSIGIAGGATYQGMDTNELEATAAWMASAIYNASSVGSEPAEVAGPGGARYYGLERLPFIREVYLQGRFKQVFIPSLTSDDEGYDPFVDPNATNDPASYFWQYQTDSQAFAVELANPFEQDIDRNELLMGGNVVELAILQDTTYLYRWTIDAVNFPAILASGTSVILYMNPHSIGSDPIANDLGAGILSGLPANSDRRQLAAVPPPAAFDRTKTITVELLVNGVAYDRLTNKPGGLVRLDLVTTPTPTSLTPTEAHRQVAYGRPGEYAGVEGPFYVSNLGRHEIMTVETTSAYATTGFHFGDANKGFTPDPALAVLQGLRLSIPNRPMVNPAEMMSLPLLGFTDVTPAMTLTPGLPSPAQTFSEWLDYYLDTVYVADNNDPRGGGYDPVAPGTGVEQIVKRLFLDFSPSATIPAGTGVPHAALVLEAISTISPQNDGIDNDNDDGDDELTTNADGQGITAPPTDPAVGRGPPELFVPGRININTAPMHVIAMAAPLPEPLYLAQALAQAIVDYRGSQDTIAGGSQYPKLQTLTNLPANPDFSRIRTDASNQYAVRGIVSLGELMWLQDPGGTFSKDMTLWNHFAGPLNASIGITPHPREVDVADATFPQGEDDIYGSAQKRAARFRYLNQVFTTRSDVYTAYIEIRGYPSDDYRKGPIERTRLIVVFDRSGVVGPAVWDPNPIPPATFSGPRPDAQVRIIAMYRY